MYEVMSPPRFNCDGFGSDPAETLSDAVNYALLLHEADGNIYIVVSGNETVAIIHEGRVFEPKSPEAPPNQ